tara:strand:+ start:64 stop:441 length:378 start_codon:yes stop_codon:yes gene_type:complete
MHKEALRYLKNAKDILKKVPIEDNFYTDIKPVREAFGTAYLAILEAINEALINKGYTRKELPKSVVGLRKALQKHLSIHNGKLMRDFERLYDGVHIAGYYRGLIYNKNAVHEYLKSAKAFINKVK